MNLYLNRDTTPTLGGHACSAKCGCTSVEMVDADNNVVGYVTNKVADHLARSGVAMDVTPKAGA